MVINGLSESRRFPRIGKVRIGEKAVSEKSGKEYPRALDYFKFDSEDEKINEVARQLFGDKPKVLTIGFPIEDEPPFEKVFPQHYKCYKAGKGLVCKGDGIRAMSADDEGRLNEIACPCPRKESQNGKPAECKIAAYMQFVISGLNVMGVWQLDTGSVNSIININSTLEMTWKLLGRIKGIPFRLSLEPQDAKVEGRKKNIFVLQMRAVGDLRMADGKTQLMIPTTPALEAAPDMSQYEDDGSGTGRLVHKKTRKPL